MGKFFLLVTLKIYSSEKLPWIGKVKFWHGSEIGVGYKNGMVWNFAASENKVLTLSFKEYDLIVPTEFNRLYRSSSSYLIISYFFYPNETDQCGIYYQIYFSICSSSSSFLKIGYLFCLTCETIKITMRKQREKRETKKSYSIAKKNLVRGHLFMTSTKKA